MYYLYIIVFNNTPIDDIINLTSNNGFFAEKVFSERKTFYCKFIETEERMSLLKGYLTEYQLKLNTNCFFDIYKREE